jgi:hypothetical protein
MVGDCFNLAGSIRLIAICGSVDVQFEEFQTLTVLSRASFRQTLNAERPIDRENSENKAQDLTMKSIARRKHSGGFEIQSQSAPLAFDHFGFLGAIGEAKQRKHRCRFQVS